MHFLLRRKPRALARGTSQVIILPMPLRDRLCLFFTSFGFLGYLPASGTAGSIAGFALYWLLRSNVFALAGLTFFLALAGIPAAGRAERILGKKDASAVVIDEVAGMLLSLLFLPVDIRIACAGFLLFRALDIIKPYPAAAAERLRGGFGIMADDLIAAVYTNCILQVAVRIVSARLS